METVSFADRLGKPMVINVWSETCEPCKREMPDFQNVHSEVSSRITFVGINSLDSIRRAKAFAEKTGVTYELWRDPSAQLFGLLKLPALPSTLFADADGRIVFSTFRVMSVDELRSKLSELFPVGAPA